MAHELHRNHFPGIAASAINAGVPVSLDTGDVQRQVLPVSTNSVAPFGIAQATAVTAGDAVPVLDALNVVKVTAAASVGAGALVGVASTNGALGPITGASGVSKWALGSTTTAGAAGETISVYVSPRQLSNLI